MNSKCEKRKKTEIKLKLFMLCELPGVNCISDTFSNIAIQGVWGKLKYSSAWNRECYYLHIHIDTKNIH